MKIFISQPMADKTDEEIFAERNAAIQYLTELYGENIEIIDSFIQDAPDDAKPLWYLGKSLELLSDAEVAYFCKGWEEHRGCRLEHEAALLYDIPEIEVDMVKKGGRTDDKRRGNAGED